MKIYFLKVENVLMIPKSYFQDNLAQYQGSKGHSATFDVSPVVFSRSSTLISARYWSSSRRSFHFLSISSSICCCSASLHIVIWVPRTLLWIWTHLYNHCPWVISRSLITRPDAHFAGDRVDPLSVKYVSCILCISLLIILSINRRQPMESCAIAIYWYHSPCPWHKVDIDTWPLPFPYLHIHCCSTGSVSTSSIQSNFKLMDNISASTLPMWFHSRIWPHASLTWAQLGHRGLRSVSRALLP